MAVPATLRISASGIYKYNPSKIAKNAKGTVTFMQFRQTRKVSDGRQVG